MLPTTITKKRLECLMVRGFVVTNTQYINHRKEELDCLINAPEKTIQVIEKMTSTVRNATVAIAGMKDEKLRCHYSRRLLEHMDINQQ